VIDRATGQPGLVKIIFNDADQLTDGEKIQAYIGLLQADSGNPWEVVSREQFYQLMDWNIEDYGDTEVSAGALARISARRPQFPFGQPNQEGQDPTRMNEARAVRVEKTSILKESEQALATANHLWARKIIEAVEKDYPVK
jgi:hypothetical protein